MGRPFSQNLQNRFSQKKNAGKKSRWRNSEKEKKAGKDSRRKNRRKTKEVFRA